MAETPDLFFIHDTLVTLPALSTRLIATDGDASGAVEAKGRTACRGEGMAHPADGECLHPAWRAGIFQEQDGGHRRSLLGFSSNGKTPDSCNNVRQMRYMGQRHLYPWGCRL